MSKRIWRYIPENINSIIFGQNSLFKILYSQITSGEIPVYDISNDDFLNVINVKDFKTKIDIKSDEIIGYKIKEDWFFDNIRMVSETRIIGICPVFKGKKSYSDSTDLCWIYFPEARKILASIMLNNAGLPSYIKTMDDLFFFRYFSSSIYKEANFHDRKISDYASGYEIMKEAERIEQEVFNMEHNIWISLAK